jgi:ribosomal protein L37E
MINLDRGNFILEGKLYLGRCPQCGEENYAANVSIGVCTWCGLDGYEYYEKQIKENNGQSTVGEI